MKRLIFILAATVTAVNAFASMSNSKLREYARFLSDRMAYELDFDVQQYEDCYEINLDFLYAVNPYLNDMVSGYSDAIDQYYTYLDERNDDLRYIMTIAQYERFLQSDYFYRPIYSTGTSWAFRIYTIYRNIDFFYYDAPSIFKTYVGAHSRRLYGPGFYADRYHHVPHYDKPHAIRTQPHFDNSRRHDFGANERTRNGGKYDINHYNNRNQSHRTQDSRYHDNSGNRNSVKINDHGSSQSREGNKATGTDSSNKQNSSSTSRSTSNTRSSSTSGGRSNSNVSSGSRSNSNSRSTGNHR